MKALLVGVGGFGFGWYENIRENYGDVQLAVVDTDESKRSKIEGDGVPFYTSVLDAIETEKPDLLINVTPKQMHTKINHIAFDHKLPVFSEKPIADNYQDAIEVVERAERENLPFMIGENYRAFIFVRKMRQLIKQGVIGELLSIKGEFSRYSDRTSTDRYSTLEELVVHHFDMIRYLTGRETRKIYASYDHSLFLWMEMQDEVIATFHCTSKSKGKQTDWAGDWRIEGTKGGIELIHNEVHLTVDGIKTVYSDYKDVYGPGPFGEFLLSMAMNREAETSARSYLKNQALAHYARESITTMKVVDTTSSWT
jgi:predicted dehydrogenase